MNATLQLCLFVHSQLQHVSVDGCEVLPAWGQPLQCCQQRRDATSRSTWVAQQLVPELVAQLHNCSAAHEGL
jgi:hypothetical protein